jgi:hypothetical protein
MSSATDILQADYKLKIDYLTAHLGRMWTRFNFFLVISSALFGYSLNMDNARYMSLLIGFGLFFSVLWYFFAATDNFLVSTYRSQVALVFALLAPSRERAFAEAGLVVPSCYGHVGSISDERLNPSTGQVEPLPKNFLQLRTQLVSVTELGVVFAVSFALLWLARGVLWLLN